MMPLRVALVYPPFGPSGIPSLGLAILAAGVKARGHDCRTFHWNLDLIAAMPGSSVRERALAYHELSGRLWFPFNEWIFARELYDRPLPHDPSTLQALWRANAELDDKRLDAPDILRLRLDARERVAAMARRLSDFDVVGIASTFYQNVAALALAKALKRANPRQRVVLGGANCDGDMGAALLETFGFLDAVFVGEADRSFPEYVERLARDEPTADVPGAVTPDATSGGGRGSSEAPVDDLDTLPYPDFDDYLEQRRLLGLDGVFERVLPLESSRGCWWGAKSHCTFCGLNALGMAYRQKSWQRFADEVRYTVDRYGARFLFMTDNIMSTRYYGEFVAWASEAGLDVDYFYEIKANLTRRHVAGLAAAGITGVQPGIESFSSEILALMRKGTTGIQNVALLKYAREYGVLLAYNLLVGFPREPSAAYERMAEDVPKLTHLQPPSGVPRVEFHRFSPYHTDPESHGLALRPSRKYHAIYPFHEDLLRRIAYLFEEEDEADIEYIAPLLQAVERWREEHSPAHCTLTWWPEQGDIGIEDQRPGFRRSRYRLQRYAVDVFKQLDAPVSLRGLLQEARAHASDTAGELVSFVFSLTAAASDAERISFSASDFVKEPTKCLEPLVVRGLLYVEPSDDPLAVRYLALPVRNNWRPCKPTWLELGM